VARRAPPPARVKILDRYLLREFTGYLLLGCSGFITILLVVEMFQRIDVFLDQHTPPLVIARYMVFQSPEKIVQILPVGMLLATFLALGQLNKFGELAAMRAAGQSLLRILTPIFAFATLLTLGVYAFNELVVPSANQERDRLLHQEIERVQREQITERADVTYLGEGGRIFIMRLYLIRERRMHEVSLQEFHHGQLWRRVDASESTWDGHRWIFTSGVVRSFEGGQEQAHPFERMAVPGIVERPEDFARENRNPAEMSYSELRRYVERLRASGARVAGYLVDLHLKLALPLVNLIVILIGGAVATRLRSQSVAIGFGLSIAIAVLYYAFVRMGQAFGHNGAFPPYLAAWSGNVLFGTVGAVMMWQAQRR
jgi:lipopolysaccharide export system permease protein